MKIIPTSTDIIIRTEILCQSYTKLCALLLRTNLDDSTSKFHFQELRLKATYAAFYICQQIKSRLSKKSKWRNLQGQADVNLVQQVQTTQPFANQHWVPKTDTVKKKEIYV